MGEIGCNKRRYRRSCSYVYWFILREQPTRFNVSKIYLFLSNFLQVSDCFPAHHQQHETTHTAPGSCHTVTAACCYPSLVPSWLAEVAVCFIKHRHVQTDFHVRKNFSHFSQYRLLIII